MTTKDFEFHVIILWHNGLQFADSLFKEVAQRFLVKKACYIQWAPERFDENLRRFYGPEATLIQEKAASIGRGPFLALLVKDPSPTYGLRQTTDGPRIVNTAILDLKFSLRAQLPDKWLLHSSVNLQEGIKDSMLLFHTPPETFAASTAEMKNLQTLNQNLMGADGFDSFDDMFKLLNHTMPYVLLFRRGYAVRDKAPFDLENGGDFDLLTLDHLQTQILLNAKKKSPDKSRRNFHVKIASRDVDVDIRDVFDGYFCPVWSADMLKRKQTVGEIAIPAEDDLFYSSLYHVCLHKGKLDHKYQFMTQEAQKRGLTVNSLQECAYHLRKYLVGSAYSAPTPTDPGLPDTSSIRPQLVRKSFIPAANNNTQIKDGPSLANVKATIPGVLDTILNNVQNTQPFSYKHSEGFYEAKLWKCDLKWDDAAVSVCIKAETFFSKEMQDHALHVVPSILAKLNSDLVPHYYGHQIRDNTLITCSEWIEGPRLFENVEPVVADLMRHGEYSLFIETLHAYLDYLKREGIEHRDIWEKNIIVRNRRPVFIDFTWSCFTGDDAYYPPRALFKNDLDAVGRLVSILDETAKRIAGTATVTAPTPPAH